MVKIQVTRFNGWSLYIHDWAHVHVSWRKFSINTRPFCVVASFLRNDIKFVHVYLGRHSIRLGTGLGRGFHVKRYTHVA